MTVNILTAAGEEFALKNALDTATLTVGLYLDATDAFTDATVAQTAITTEPTNTAYSRKSVAFSAAEISANQWGVTNDTAISFDFSDYTTPAKNVDALFLIANFTSVEGGGTLGNYIVGNAGMTQTRDIASVDSIDYAAGAISVTLE